MSKRDAFLLLFVGILAAFCGVALFLFALDPESQGVRGPTIFVVFLCGLGSFFAFFRFFGWIRAKRADSKAPQFAEKVDTPPIIRHQKMDAGKALPKVLRRLPKACWRFLTTLLTPGLRLTSGLFLLLFSCVALWVLWNVPENGSSTFSADEIKDLSALIQRLRQPTDPVSDFLWQSLSAQRRELLENYRQSSKNRRLAPDIVVQALNKVIGESNLYDTSRFQLVRLRTETTKLLKQSPTGRNLVYLNRLLLEDAYPLELSKNHHQQFLSRRLRFTLFYSLLGLIGIPLIPSGIRGICKKDSISIGVFAWRIIAGVAIAGCAFSIICLFVGISEFGSDTSISIIIVGTIILVFSIVGVIMARSRTEVVNPLRFASKIDYGQNVPELPDSQIIRAILLDKAIPAASTWLIVWGLINGTAWLFGYQTTVERMGQLKAPLGTSGLLFLYGGGIIGVTMLAFGIFGKIIKSSLVGHTSGLLLVVVGLWNVISDFIVKVKTNTHGGSVWSFWTVIGVIQVSSGFAELARFWRLGFYPRGIGQEMKQIASLKLQELIGKPVKYEIGPFKIEKGNRSNPFYAKSDAYTMWLLPDKAVFLRDDLKDYFEVDRQKNKGRRLGGGTMADLTMNDSAVKACNEWLRVHLNDD